MFRHYTPYQIHRRSFSKPTETSKNSSFVILNPTTNPNFIPLPNQAKNTVYSTRRQGRDGFAGQNSVSSSQRSFGPPPGFERKSWNTRDVEDGFENSNWRKETEKQKQIGHENNLNRTEEEKKEKRVLSTIHISNVSINVTAEEVLKCCKVFGVVENFKILKSFKIPQTQFCFVKYQSRDQAETAARRLRGIRRDGRFWNVGWARRESESMQEMVDKKTEGPKEGVDFEEIEGVENGEIVRFLKRSWVVVTEKHRTLKEIREAIEEVGLTVMMVVRWGSYGAIAVAKEERDEGKWVDSLQLLRKHFVKIEKFDEEWKNHPRFAWIEVSGIPIQTWSTETMENIAAKIGKLVALDKETDRATRMDVARLFIETEKREKIDTVGKLRYKRDVFEIKMVEIERAEDVEFMLSQDSSLGKKISSPEKSTDKSQDSPVENVWEDIDMGGQDFENRNSWMQNEPRRNVVLEAVLEENPLDEPIRNERSEESSIQANETQVQETPASHVRHLPRTPVFNSKSNKNSMEDPSIRNKEVGVGKSFAEKEKDGECLCCEKFRDQGARQDKKVGEDKGEGLREEQAGGQKESPNSREDTGTGSQKRSKNVGKKPTPRKRGSKGVMFGKLALKERLGKSKKVQGRRNIRKNIALQLHDTTSESDEIVNSGIELCEQVGVKIRNKGPKRLEFENFILEERT